MKNIILTLFIILTVNIINAQSDYKHKTDIKKLKCTTCHSCEVPTKNNPCLYPCPRYIMPVEKLSALIGPETVTINKIKSKQDLYKPVVFSHRLHAEMSDMSGGCETCHHYNPVGKILKCESCHSVERKRENID
jgi:hypothetical protein